ncbi:hypothetical protein DITRI_Ditri19aG0060400 [Diplodiscus trichospermus]
MELESGDGAKQPQQQQPNTIFSSSAASNVKPIYKGKAIAQFNADAELMVEFVLSGLKDLIGIDARSLFKPASGAPLAKAAASREISLLNPVWLYSRSTQKLFYAILHRINVGIVIDLEPARLIGPALSLAGSVHSQKLTIRAIARLQSLPGGDIGVLCDTVVEDVQMLTGYDGVMVYKFHDDDHGEVVSKIRRSDLEPYWVCIILPQLSLKLLVSCSSRIG